MPIFDEMEKQKALSFIMSRHEQGAVFHGPGHIPGLPVHGPPPDRRVHGHLGPRRHEPGHRYRRCQHGLGAPLAITGQVPSSVIATDAFQESDVVGVMMPLTKQTYMPLSVNEIEETIHEAMYVASIRPRRTGGGRHPQGCPAPGDGQCV
jgi:acetolactate synthase-1/2/3 large subunit